ncbi:PH domain-containing protein [soil metagenome]
MPPPEGLPPHLASARPEGPSLPTAEHPARLPWAAILLEGRRLIFGLVGLALVAGPYLLWPMAAFVVLILARSIQLRLLRYWLTPDSFVIERGLLFRSRRVISRSRIQAVDLERGLLHRLLQITEVRVEALGGGDTEGALPGVRPLVAEALRTELLARGPDTHPSGTESASPEEAIRAPFLQLSGGEVVLAGLTESRLGAGIAVVGVGAEAVRQGAFSGWFGPLEAWTPVLVDLPWVALLIGAGVLVFLFSLLLSFVLTALGYWGFTLHLRDDVLEVERGLLTQHRDTVPLARIQAVRVEENPFRRLMGLASVRVVVAGRAQKSASAGTNVLLPVGPRARAFALATLVAEWVPGTVSEGDATAAAGSIPQLVAMPAQARSRRRFRAGMAAVVGGLAGPLLLTPASGVGALLPWTWTGGMWWTGAGVALGLAVAGFLLAEAAWRGLGWAERGDHVAFREGILTRRTTMVPLSRLQSVEVVSTLFQRRRHLATLAIPVARPPLETDPRALDLDQDVAEALRLRVLARERGGRATARGASHGRVSAGLSEGVPGGMFRGYSGA